MEITIKNKKTECAPEFKKEILEAGTGMERCYQCFTCALGCPVSYLSDYTPNQIIRLVQLGLKNEVLNSKQVWLCANCETCVARCPNEVDIVKLMDTLREIAISQGISKGDAETKCVPIFHEAFLNSIARGGRVHELGMIAELKLKTGEAFKPSKQLFEDAILGFKMFTKGKLALIPHKIKGVDKVKKIYEKAKS
jgi:heterodisulfide reductase subunit C